MKNLGTQHPTIVLQSGEQLQATYKESFGTHMVYTTQPGDDNTSSVQFLCHTANTLCTSGQHNGDASSS